MNVGAAVRGSSARTCVVSLVLVVLVACQQSEPAVLQDVRFQGDDCAEVGREYGVHLRETTMDVLDRVTEEGEVETVTTVDELADLKLALVNRAIARLVVEDVKACSTEMFLSAAETEWDQEFRRTLALWLTGDPASGLDYEFWREQFAADLAALLQANDLE